MTDDKALQSALFHLRNDQPFFGGILQELTIKYSTEVPTAAFEFNVKSEQYQVLLNPTFFKEHLTTDFRTSILHHEILHFTSKHIFRLDWLKATPEDRMIMNIAGDASINQYIKALPDGCPTCPHATEEDYLAAKCPGKAVNIGNFKMDDGSPFPTFQTIEVYYDLLKSEQEKQKGNPKTKGNVNEKLGEPHHTDEHNWEGLDEKTKQKMLEEAKKVLKRAIEKSQFGHSSVPESIKDLLEEIEVAITGINYKKILKNAIKKNVSCTDKEATWKKPNRRYGALSPGSKLGALPKLGIYVDSSGSISHTEMNKFLEIIDGFLKVGTRECTLGLWHTRLYYKKKYKLNKRLAEDDIQSGGTDVSCVLEDAAKSNHNLTLVLTDGYYDNSDIKVNGELIWLISENGNADHPLKHVGKTIMLAMLKDGE